ncbi:riboflavin synthase subunit alpha, partial [Bacillus inaquosorum]|nr:riboflavin synthase subunit alpha [Bacillus inaquosorum]
AMAANGRLGGHFVSGHVDGTAEITRIEEKSNAVYYDLKMDPSLTKTLVLKGSITVDGVSLTIFGLTEDTVTISLIPHTISETIFSEKTIGSKVNIECDMIGKYMYRFLHKANENKTQQNITKAFLSENGF